MRIRRALLPVTLVACAALTACGGGDDTSDDDVVATQSDKASPAATDGASDGAIEGLPSLACDLLSTDEVAAAVGSKVKAGTPLSGPAVTGGEFSTCAYASDDPDNPADTATITLYPNLEAAEQGRGDDAEPIEGLGDQAWASSFASVWVNVGDVSLFTQWYSFDGTDEESLPKSTALAQAAVDALG